MEICGEIIFYEKHFLELHSRTALSKTHGRYDDTDGGIVRGY